MSIPAHTRSATPLVSVVMPVKNGQRFLDEAIQSILSQTLKDIELIVVVNGSTDSSLEIAGRYAKRDARVRILELEQGNAVLAMNAGVESARAPWIARMDSDDISLPTRLETQVAFLGKNPDVAAVGSEGDIIGLHGKVVGKFSAPGPKTREEFQRIRDSSLMFMLASSVVFSRDVALKIGGHRKEYITAQDVEFWTRIADDHVVLSVPETLVQYRIHGSSASMGRYFEQSLNARWATHNMVRRRQGQLELERDEYRALEDSEAFVVSARRRTNQASHFLYRKGGSMVASGQYTGFGWLMLSAVVNPTVPIKRFREQILPRLTGTH